MASESRFKRRHFSQNIKEILDTTPADQRRLRVILPMVQGEPYYVFLLFPLLKSESVSYDEYREVRKKFLYTCCMVTKLEYPDALDIVEIATETGLKNNGRSEDASYLNASIGMKNKKKRLGRFKIS